MRLVVHEEATAELEAAAIWYEQHRIDLGQDLLAETARAIELIEQSPETWPPWHKVPHRGVRQFLLTRFPYRVLYVIRGEDALVVAFAHTSRDPTYWVGRLRQVRPR